jgi:hypothetical protein
LPGNEAILYTITNGPLANARVGILSMATGERRELLEENGFSPRYAASGHIVFARGVERKLMAVRFDPDKLEISGTPQPVLDTALAGQGIGGSTDYALATNGTLVYRERGEESVDEVVAHFGNFNLVPIHVRLNWFVELKRVAP